MQSIFSYSVRIEENVDYNNSKYGHFLGSVFELYFTIQLYFEQE